MVPFALRCARPFDQQQRDPAPQSRAAFSMTVLAMRERSGHHQIFVPVTVIRSKRTLPPPSPSGASASIYPWVW
jgi:hypothetical protein